MTSKGPDVYGLPVHPDEFGGTDDPAPNGIRVALEKYRVPPTTVDRALELAKESEGVCDLLWLFTEAETEEDKAATLKTIEECIADHAEPIMRVTVEGKAGVGKSTLLRVLFGLGYKIRRRKDAHGREEADIMEKPAVPPYQVIREAQNWRLIRDLVHKVDTEARGGTGMMADDDVLGVLTRVILKYRKGLT
jgi:hypothetical protein